MARQYNLVSADSHVVDPPNLWKDWLAKKYHDQAPRLVKDEDGGDAWLYAEGTKPEPLGLNACVGIPYDKMRWTGLSFETNLHPSCYRGQDRLAAMDFDGIDAEVEYPHNRTIMYLMRCKDDPDFQVAAVQAYNDWLVEDFCAADHERLVALAQIPNAGIERSLAELKRSINKGHRGVLLAAWPSGGDILSEEDDPFWALAEEMEVPINFHLAPPQPGAPPINVQNKKTGVFIGAADLFIPMARLLPNIIASGMLDRFPQLKIVAVESGVGWVPHLLEMLDDRYWRNRTWTGIQLKHQPSEYWYRNWLGTFIIDRSGVALRHRVGVENMMWSTDFPHHGNDWPYSRKLVDDMFAGVASAERHKIVAGNCARLFKLI